MAKNWIYGNEQERYSKTWSNLVVSNRYNNFVEKPNLTEKCCLLVASRKNRDNEGGGRGPEARLCKQCFLLPLVSIRPFRLATLFSDINRIDFNGKADEIESIKQTFGDFLKKVISETSQGQESDDRFA